MKLLIDAGNTLIKWAVADLDGISCSGQLPVGKAGDLQFQIAKIEGIRQVWASNVAGVAVARQIRKACPHPPNFIVAQREQCGVQNGYAIPSQLGSDRWAALIAAWHMVHGTCLVVNSGTATTVDALSASGEFIGGLILPGVELMQSSLRNRAFRLRTTEPLPGKYAPFPQNTADALYNGALQASCGAIERQRALLDDGRPKLQQRGRAPVVVSGGSGKVLRDHLNWPLHMVDNLVLQGILLISQDAQ